MSDWREAHCDKKVVSKLSTSVFGELWLTIYLAQLMLKSPAMLLDSGECQLTLLFALNYAVY